MYLLETNVVKWELQFISVECCGIQEGSPTAKYYSNSVKVT